MYAYEFVGKIFHFVLWLANSNFMKVIFLLSYREFQSCASITTDKAKQSCFTIMGFKFWIIQFMRTKE